MNWFVNPVVGLGVSVDGVEVAAAVERVVDDSAAEGFRSGLGSYAP